jgi:hypothetical protein
MNTNRTSATGEVARLLNETEPRLNNLIRRGRLSPPPPIHAGRRAWTSSHIIQAAKLLGVLTDELRARLEQEVA